MTVQLRGVLGSCEAAQAGQSLHLTSVLHATVRQALPLLARIGFVVGPACTDDGDRQTVLTPSTEGWAAAGL